MADEFIKGFAILTSGMLGWMVFAGWYNTPSFEEGQFAMPPPEELQMLDQLALTFKSGLLWFAILGALVFWVVIPLAREIKKAQFE
jgi:hypothetical protein